ncbi:MFS transporter [Nonomuraea sp. NPDC003754]
MRRYLAAVVAARTGDEMSGPALLLLGLAATGSPSLASWLLAGLTVAAAGGGPVLGAALDRTRRPGRLLAALLAGYAAGLVIILALVGRAPDPVVIGVAVLAGLLGPALSGGWTAQLPLLVPPDRLPRANALDSIAYNLAGLAGPALAGLVAAAGGAWSAVVASAALIAAALPAAWFLPARPAAAVPTPTASPPPKAGIASAVPTPTASPPPEAGTAPGPAPAPAALAPAPAPAPAATDPAEPHPSQAVSHSSPAAGEPQPGMRRELIDGFAALARNGSLRRATLASMISYAGLAMLVVSAPLLGTNLLGDPGYGALLLSVLAAAALVANAVLARFPATRPDIVVPVSALVIGAGLALAAFAGTFAWAVLAVALVGVGEGPQLTALFAVRHREAPSRLRTQVFTTGASLKITSFALGSAAAGPLAGHSPTAALLVGAAVQLTAAAAFVLSYRPARRVDGPGSPSAVVRQPS